MKTFEFWPPIVVSLAVTPVALFVGLVSAGAGHGNYVAVKILFPYTMLSTVLFESINTPFVVLGLVQFPLYGLILGLAGQRFESVAKVLAIVHVLAVLLCFALVSKNFS